jgi:hypothetical protein
MASRVRGVNLLFATSALRSNPPRRDYAALCLISHNADNKCVRQARPRPGRMFAVNLSIEIRSASAFITLATMPAHRIDQNRPGQALTCNLLS